MGPKSTVSVCGVAVVSKVIVGAQGGDLAAAVAYGADAVAGPVINAGRNVLYASAGLDFAAAARAEAGRLRTAINALRAV